MKRLVKWISALMVTMATLLSQTATADQFVAYGDYEIHYIAFNSTFIQPDVAQKVGIQRSKRKALVNVSVLKVADGKKTPAAANVSGKATNLIQQSQDIRFKKVDEGDAIYYLGQFGYTDDQVMRLVLDVQPDPNKPAFKVQFEQKFYEE